MVWIHTPRKGRPVAVSSGSWATRNPLSDCRTEYQTAAVSTVDYEGRLATVFNAGLSLLPEAEEAWTRTVAPYVGAGTAVLDVGAGTGRFADLFASRLGARAVAVEPAVGMRDRRRSIGTAAWTAGRAEQLPLRDHAVDVVWLCCVIHYLDLVEAGHEIARVLKPDGHVLVRSCFPDRFDELVWMRWFPAARAIDEARMPTVEQVVDAWGAAGLQLVQRQPSAHLIAQNLDELADRLAHRAISTLELLTDEQFDAGMTALRHDARRRPREPVYSTVDTLVFALGQ
jgi:ubiquinone/menaquinone biosynthesis C-methylase UbiE